MKLSEAAQILGMIALERPGFNCSDERVLLWYDSLKDVDFTVAKQATRLCLERELGFVTLAHIRAAIADVLTPADEKITPEQAWTDVVAVVRDMHSGKPEAINKLPEHTRDIVRALTSWEIRTTDKPSILRAQFIKLYQEALSRKAAERQLSSAVKRPPALESKVVKLVEGGKA